MPLVDTQVAQVLLQTAAAVRLLGARPLLVGIRPEVAQTIISLGLDFAAIATLGLSFRSWRAYPKYGMITFTFCELARLAASTISKSSIRLSEGAKVDWMMNTS